MFFPETEIVQTLNCPVCKSGLEDPRIVPCGETVCNSCVLLNTTLKQFGLLWSEPRFRCVCEQEHAIPQPQGFPLNKLVAALIEKKPVEISRGADAKQLSERLQKIVATKTKLLERDAAKETVVKNYFEFVRSDVENAAESLIKDVVQLKEGYLKTINQFEAKCLERVHNDADFKPGFQRSLAETDKFIEAWSKYLAAPDISSPEVERAIKECRAIEKLLDEEHDRMKMHAFNNRVPLFKANPRKLDKSQLGTLSVEFLQQIMFDKLACIELSKCMKKGGVMLNIDCLQNENVVFLSYVETAAPESSVRYSLATFDKNSNPLHHYTLPFDVCASQKSNYHMITFENQTLFALTGPNSKNYQQHVYVFDEHLKVQAQMPYQTLNSQIECLDADADAIYVLAGNSRQDREIHKFNWSLEPLTTQAPMSSKYLKYTRHMYARHNFVFLINQDVDEIVVLDKSDGTLCKKLTNMELPGAEILLSNDKIFLKDNKSNRIKSYDFNGDLESEVQIEKRSLSKLKFSVNKATDGLIFYDSLGVYF